MADVNSSRFTASRAALVAMTRIETACALASHGRKSGNSLGGGGNGLGLQAMRLVEAVPEASLFALLADRPNLAAVHIGHQQLHGVGADIDHRAADGLPWGEFRPLPGKSTSIYPKLVAPKAPDKVRAG
jgi:hypothetical protein